MSDQRLFISHASEDESTVSQIVSYLETNGAPCWISSRDIPPRSIYAEAIATGIQQCSACVVVLSAAANASDAVKRELELASHYRKAFIPIRIDATEPGPGLDYYLRNAQWLDFRRDGERALERIVAPARKTPAPSPAPAAAPPRKTNVAPLAIMATIAAAGLGGWFAWTQLAQPSTPVGAWTYTTVMPPLIGLSENELQPTWKFIIDDDGAFSASDGTGSLFKGTWSQKGRRITLVWTSKDIYGEHTYDCIGTLSGDYIKGDWTNRTDAEVPRTCELSRLQPNAS